MDPRIARNREIGTEIDGLSDDEFVRLLSGADRLDRGHTTLSLPQSSSRVFVKLVPVTALELQAQHRHSTANLFQLPTCYHYRIGSCGFGAWRELEAHQIANQWVLSGQRPHFPLLHGWRILPLVSHGADDKRSLEPWGGDPAILRRVSAVAEATSSAVLFLEHFPQTLGQWLRDRLTGEPDPLVVVRETEATLLDLLTFLDGQGFLHMDAHFENILTDGTQLYLGDYGLAISRTFRLDPEELTFFERHESFDRCTAITSLVHAVVTHYDSREDWRQTLRELTDGSHSKIESVPVAVRSYLEQRGPVALAVGDFYRRLTADLATEYPATSLREILADL